MIRPPGEVFCGETPWAARAAARSLIQAFQVRDGRVEPIPFFSQLSQHVFQIH